MIKREICYFFIVPILIIGGCRTSHELPLSLTKHKKNVSVSITVRTHEFNEYQFVKDTVEFEISFENQNNSPVAKGQIGMATFEQCPVRYNQGILPPSITGIEWIVSCERMGKLFAQDPLENKQMEIWVSPEDENGQRSFEIRYTDGMAKFPMAGGTWAPELIGH